MKTNRTLKLGFKFIQSSFNFNLLLLLIFLFVAAFGMVNHEMWRDELEAWTIARDSRSISELSENLKYTGHPLLWYLCLYFLSKISNTPLIMQLFHLIIAAGVIFTFLYYSPFNKLQKALFCFGYFPLYEYGIISRSYSLGVLLIFGFCALFCHQKYSYIILAIVLGLLSHTSAYGLIIGVILAFAIAYRAIVEINRRRILALRQRNVIRNLSIGLTIYLSSVLTAIAQIIPPSTAEKRGNIYSIAEQSNLERIKFFKGLEKAVTGVWRSYVPIPDLSMKRFWGSNVIPNDSKLPDIATIDLGSYISTFLSLILFVVFIIIFLRSHRALFIYIFGTLAITLFSLVVKLPAIRHNGHLFIILIACFWIHAYESRQNYHSVTKSYLVSLVSNYQNVFLTVILCLQLYVGMTMYAIDLVRPFSNSRNAARFILENNLEELTIVGSKDKLVSPLSAWLDREIYYPEIRGFGTFTVWTSKNKLYFEDPTQQDILEQVERLNTNSSNGLLLILSQELKQTPTSLDIELIASFENSMVIEEEYFIYLVNRPLFDVTK